MFSLSIESEAYLQEHFSKDYTVPQDAFHISGLAADKHSIMKILLRQSLFACALLLLADNLSGCFCTKQQKYRTLILHVPLIN